MPPPAPADLTNASVVHAIDGDGTPLCGRGLRIVQVDDLVWADIPDAQQCALCHAILDGRAVGTSFDSPGQGQDA
jgi:hypothetical protein